LRAATGETATAAVFADVEQWSLPAATVVLGATLVVAVRHRDLPARAAGLGLLPTLTVALVPTWCAVVGSRLLGGALVGGELLAGGGRLVAGDPGAGPAGWRLGLAFVAAAGLAVAAALAPLVGAPVGALVGAPVGAPVAGPGPLPVATTAPQPSAVRALLTWPLALVAGSAAAVLAGTAWSTFEVPVEVATVTVGVLALVLGGLRLAAVPALRSWPALGPGLVVALAPSLLLAAGGPSWRVLGLVVAAGASVGVGAARRLAAPVVVGGSVLAAHAVGQLAPYVATLSGSQWRWVVFAAVGAALLGLGATYERRLAQLRAARTRIAALR
jgi:hypothetical protein